MLATVHRNYNTDDAGAARPRSSPASATADCRVIFPLHPRTRKAIAAWNLAVPTNVESRGPVTYTEMLALERDAVAIATDSGGVQREAYLWGVPCITLREETEWIETVSTGWNTLVGADPEQFRLALERPRPAARPPIFGDGRAGGADRRADRRRPRRRPGGLGCLSSSDVGVVGCGRMGAFHVRNLLQLECAQLVAVADPDEGARRGRWAG